MRNLLTLGSALLLYAGMAMAQQTPPGHAGSPPNPARGVQGQNPSAAAQTASGQKSGKSMAKHGQSAAKGHSQTHAGKGTAREHTPPAAGNSLRRWKEPSDDQPDAVTPLSKTLVLIKA